MALHEVDLKTADKRSYCVKMLEEFLASDMMAARVDVPENTTPATLRNNLYNRIRGRGLNDKVVVRMVKNNIYLLKK